MAQNTLQSNPENLYEAFNHISELAKAQSSAAQNFDASSKYKRSEGESADLSELLMGFYQEAFNDMKVGTAEGVENWRILIKYREAGVVHGEDLYECLRKLPDDDIWKIRTFNRLIGQEYFRVSLNDMVEHQEDFAGEFSNGYFSKLRATLLKFGKLTETDDEIMKTIKGLEWPTKRLAGEDRKGFLKELQTWINAFYSMPGIRIARYFFSKDSGVPDYEKAFNDFFHLQRQFDSDNWRDFDEKEQPHPQPLPRVNSYREAIMEVNDEFTEAESVVSMCYDYCRMKQDTVITYIQQAEDVFLKIVNQLDENYPIEVDYGHRFLHNRAKEIKHMMYPLRCLFFEELDNRRGVKDSNDKTLDTYFDMSLSDTKVSVPPDYRQSFAMEDLDPEIREVIELFVGSEGFKKILPGKKIGFVDVVSFISMRTQEENEATKKECFEISGQYESKYKSEEGNISRRLARITYLFAAALAKKAVMKNACQKRLDSIEDMAGVFFKKAEGFNKVDLDNDNVYKTMDEKELPLIASPEQMEDFFNTQKVVQRLSEGNEEFDEAAKRIQAGLEAAMEMLRKSELFLERLTKKLFPKDEDRRDLLEVIKKLISISYKTQQTLADQARKEALKKKGKKSGMKKRDQEKEEQLLKQFHEEVEATRNQLKHILGEKKKIIQMLRVTEKERESCFKQLRMITMMTINSMQAQGQGEPPVDDHEEPAEK